MRLTEKENEMLPIDVGFLLFFTPFYYRIYQKWYSVLSKSSELPFLVFFYLQIVLQTLLSFVMTCYGIVHIAGEFREMDASSELKNRYACIFTP